jgi:cytochrome P450
MVPSADAGPYDPAETHLHAPEVRRDPYPYFAWLRETSPAHWCGRTDAFLISRHADVVRVMRDPATFSSTALKRQEPGETGGTINVITTDPPDHTRLRAVLQRRFMKSALAAMQPRIDGLAEAMVARMRESDEFDLVHDFTVPLPVTVIAEMMGVPVGRRGDFARWSDALMKILEPKGTDAWMRGREGVFELIAFFEESMAARRERGGADGGGGDLLDLFLAAEAAGDMNRREAVSYCTLLLVAGNETTTDLLGGLIPALLDHPDQLARLEADPGLIPKAIEEGLRYCGPVQGTYRRAMRDVELSGASIREGQDVAVLLGAANRDPAKFPEPDRFDIGRETAGHVGFGFGIHHCLGAHLARREAAGALGRILPHLGRMRPRSGRVEIKSNWLVRGPVSLPYRWAA